MRQRVYLAAAIAISIIASLIVYYRSGRPRSIEDGVQQFSRGLDALGTTRPASTRPRARGVDSVGMPRP